MMRALIVLLVVAGCRSSGPTPAAVTESLTARLEPFDSVAARQIFGERVTFEVLIGGLTWSEGPLALADGTVLCSDVPNNRIMYWRDGEQGVWLENAGNAPDDYSSEPGSNGLALDAEGRLLLCQHGSRQIARLDAPLGDPRPNYVTLADRYNGKRFNSPNDLVVAKDGSILFTDPIYGLPGRADSKVRELDHCGVYRLDPRGRVSLLTKAYERPNGIGLSPDNRTLYLGNSDRAYFVVTATPILDADFTLGEPRELINATDLVGREEGSCDGLTVARSGRLFATAPGGVWVMDPDGTLLAKFRTGTKISNVELSPDEDWLYMTCDDYLTRVKLAHP